MVRTIKRFALSLVEIHQILDGEVNREGLWNLADIVEFDGRSSKVASSHRLCGSRALDLRNSATETDSS